jgi:L-threonylcarbamoyladenylate synthase
MCSGLTIEEQAIHVLRGGGLVAYPTETFYGIGALAGNGDALERLSALKNRPADSPFPLLIPALDSIAGLSTVSPNDPALKRLAESFWPGPLTLVLPARPCLCSQIVGPGGGVAVRVSSAETATRLVAGAESPITTTSANFRGHDPACSAEDIEASGLAAALDFVIDGGQTAGASPSTVLQLDPAQATVLREGAIATTALAEVLAELDVRLVHPSSLSQGF